MQAPENFHGKNRRHFMLPGHFGATDSCADPGADPPTSAGGASASDRALDVSVAVPAAPSSAPAAPSSTPGGLSPTPPTCLSSTGAGAPVTALPVPLSPLHGGHGESASDQVATTGGSSVPVGSPVATPLASPPQRPATHLQASIRKPKMYTNGTIRYGNLANVSEPHTVADALHNPNWKAAMDVEFDALLKNKTWHLVPPQRGQEYS